MKYSSIFITLSFSILLACRSATPSTVSIAGTWQLVSGTTITRGVSSTTDYTKGSKMIKIINDSHFAFLRHDVDIPADSSNHFDAGGGRYTLTGNHYTEYLDYYTDRNWEGKTFSFTVSISHDTLVQTGMEKVEAEGIDRQIIERYVRIK